MVEGMVAGVHVTSGDIAAQLADGERIEPGDEIGGFVAQRFESAMAPVVAVERDALVLVQIAKPSNIAP